MVSAKEDWHEVFLVVLRRNLLDKSNLFEMIES